MAIWGQGGKTLRSCHGDQTRTWRVGAGRGKAAAADWLGSHCCAEPKRFLSAQAHSFPGRGVWRRLSWDLRLALCRDLVANPRAELPVTVDRGDGTDTRVARSCLRQHVQNPPRRSPGALRLRFESSHLLTLFTPGEAAQPGGCPPVARTAAQRLGRQGPAEPCCVLCGNPESH